MLKANVGKQTSQPRREYNQWVANETLEDFALRHTARRARRWSFTRIANTALGTSSFLVLELLGATIALSYGVYHSLWAIAIVCTILFLSGLPISYYAAKYSVDIDLLTRGAGFGYIGSTISSLIYASFTFIFFALEAAIMASALQLLFELPLWLGYIVSALAVIPLVTHGIAMISRFQLITQPLWILLQLAPVIYVAQQPQGIIQEWLQYSGEQTATSNGFNLVIFGTATAVLFSLIAQIGEQVDFLRFLPEPKKEQRLRWWVAVITAGPGWVIIGAVKLVLGTALAYLLIRQGASTLQATDPVHMYSAAFNHFTSSNIFAVVLAAAFVVICQVKINVANAYAGSLAWSNFFSRLTHHHPGRVVWLIFNVIIALMLMELGVYRAIEIVLHHYSAFVLAWLGSIVADLVINKPLKLSPSYIEFKRSKLYDINPVGVGSTFLAAAFGICASTGLFGETAAALSGFIAFLLPFISVPLIAYLTHSRFYLAPTDAPESAFSAPHISVISDTTENSQEDHLCTVCENKFDREDMSYCPAYASQICSLCCALETRCNDQCRPTAHFSAQLEHLLRPRLPEKIYHYCVGSIGQFFLSFIFITTIVLGILYLSYLPLLSADFITEAAALQTQITSFFLLLILLGVIVWLFVLAQKSTRMALQETNLQTKKLSTEISAHKVTLQKLEYARKTADSANVAKSDYVTALSHELRTPLNVLLGYAQLLQEDHEIPEVQRDKLSILRNNGEHLATMIEGLLEISKIEAGKLNLNRDDVRLDLMLEQMDKMFRYQAECKGLTFDYSCPPNLPPTIKVDEKRLRQILINLLSNAIKFTEQGGINFSVTYRGHVARFSVSDTGYGISAEHLKNVFIPFERGALAGERQIPGSGLGLAICRQLADMMGADIEVKSNVGIGSTFTLLLQLSPIKNELVDKDSTHSICGYQGERKTILSIDDNQDHRQLLANFLLPLGFTVLEANDSTSSQAIMSDGVDLVLLDIRLGTESGWDIAKSLRSQYDRLPIVMVSANARGFHNKVTNQRIHDDYLEKPVQLHALLDKIGNLLDLEWIQKENLRFNSHSNSDRKEETSLKNNKAENIPDIGTTSVSAKDTSFALTDKNLHQLIDYARTGNLNAFLDMLLNATNTDETSNNGTNFIETNNIETNSDQDLQNRKDKGVHYTSEDFIMQLKSLASEFKFESIVNLLTPLTSSAPNKTGDSHD